MGEGESRAPRPHPQTPPRTRGGEIGHFAAQTQNSPSAEIGRSTPSASWTAESPLELKMMNMEEALSCPGTGVSAQLKTKKPEAITKEPKADPAGSL